MDTWKAIRGLDLTPCVLILQIAIILSDWELVREDRQLVQIVIPRPHNLQIVLKHKQPFRILNLGIIQRIMNARDHFSKTQVINLMREIQALFQILLNIMDMRIATLEGPSGGDMEIPGDFVDSDFSSDSTPLVSLFFDLVEVPFASALFDGFWMVEGPTGAFVGLSDVFTGVTAAGFGL